MNRISLYNSSGICCPGGLYTALDYEPWELQRAFSAHHVCGPDGISLIHQLPTGFVTGISSLIPRHVLANTNLFLFPGS